MDNEKESMDSRVVKGVRKRACSDAVSFVGSNPTPCIFKHKNSNKLIENN